MRHLPRILVGFLFALFLFGTRSDAQEEHSHRAPEKLGAVVAKLMGDDPEQQVMNDLRQFKIAMEPSNPIESGDVGPTVQQLPVKQ